VRGWLLRRFGPPPPAPPTRPTPGVGSPVDKSVHPDPIPVVRDAEFYAERRVEWDPPIPAPPVVQRFGDLTRDGGGSMWPADCTYGLERQEQL